MTAKLYYKKSTGWEQLPINTQMLSPVIGTTVGTTAWTQQSTPDVTGYPWRASVTYTGLTANDYISVVFAQEDIDKGILSNLCNSAAGVVYIYAKEKPTSPITVATMQAWRKL